jgi:NAD(P)-dependent dehydrogenase (short-subunit alcohol dehydrogenase family)
MNKMGRLDDKVAIVTGGASGMGRTTAVLFAKEGAKVVVADCVVEGGEETVSNIRNSGGEAIFVKTDVSKEPEVQAMVKRAVDAYGKLDILFNCAGILERENVPLHEVKAEDFDKVIAVNLRGVFLGMKYAIPEMIKNGGGSIINQGSISELRGVPCLASYASSKGGLASMSRAAAADYIKYKIRVNWTLPGLIATPMVSRDAVHGDTEALEQLRLAQPMERFAEEEEIAYLVLFLASDEAPYVTGTGVKIDGGLTLGTPFR